MLAVEMLWVIQRGLEGVSAVALAGNTAFVALYGSILFAEFKKRRKEEAWRLARQFFFYGIVGCVNLFVIFPLLGYRWSSLDTTAAKITLVGFAVAMLFRAWKGLPFTHPWIKECVIFSLKPIPQTLAAWKIIAVGSAAGVSLAVCLVAVFFVGVRILVLCVSARDGIWSLEQKTSMRIDVCNIATLILITLARISVEL